MQARQTANHLSRESGPQSLVSPGAKLGLRAGLRLSIAYAIVGVFVEEIARQLPGINPLSLIGAIGGSFVLVLVSSPIIFLFAIVPAILYGLFTGALLGKMAELMKNALARPVFAGFSLLICSVIVLASHEFFQLNVSFSFVQSISLTPGHSVISLGGDVISLVPAPFDSYPFYIGIPSLIYILTGGWAGWRLYDHTTAPPGSNGA